MIAKKSKTFIIDSHRGVFKSGLLENSIPAFEESYYEGANCVECDIRITKDKKIVLIHDNTINHIASFAEKTPDVAEFRESPIGAVKNHTLAYLKGLKFPKNAEILTLSEFLNLLKRLKIGAQIELKEGGYEDLILKVIEKADIDYENFITPIVCTSFNYFAVKRLIYKAKSYQIPLYSHSGDIGLAFGIQGIPLGTFFGKWFLRNWHRKNIWGGMTHYRNLPIKRIEYAHKFGFKFCPRVPNQKDLVMSYIKADVDGFETDDIPFIRSCIQEAGYKLPPIPKK